MDPYSDSLFNAHKMGVFIDLANQLYNEAEGNDVIDVKKLLVWNHEFIDPSRPEYMDAFKKLLGRIKQIAPEDYECISKIYPKLVEPLSAESERIIKEFEKIDEGIRFKWKPEITDSVLEDTQYTSKNIRYSINLAIIQLEKKLKELKSQADNQIDVALDEKINTVERLLNQLRTFNYTRPLFKRIEQLAKECEANSLIYKEQLSERDKLAKDSSISSSEQFYKCREVDAHCSALRYILYRSKQIMSADINEYREILSALKEAFLLTS